MHDPELRERLRPTTAPRASGSSSRPTSTTRSSGPTPSSSPSAIERVEPARRAHRATAALHELDVLVLATGFKADAFMRPMQVIGRDGTTLDEAWTPRPRPTCRSRSPSFPNFFMLNGPNGPVGQLLADRGRGAAVRATSCSSSSSSATADAARSAPTPEALDRVRGRRASRPRGTRSGSTGCRSWYLDDRGVPMVWPWPFSTLSRGDGQARSGRLRAALSLAGHMPKAAERNRSTASGGPRSSTWACPERPER